jgi:hypothetical protein
MIELTRETTIVIAKTDLAVILTEAFCGTYTPFSNLYVENVREVEEDETSFELSLSVKETEAV